MKKDPFEKRKNSYIQDLTAQLDQLEPGTPEFNKVALDLHDAEEEEAWEKLSGARAGDR